MANPEHLAILKQGLFENRKPASSIRANALMTLNRSWLMLNTATVLVYDGNDRRLPKDWE